jgi:hypothetical protein
MRNTSQSTLIARERESRFGGDETEAPYPDTRAIPGVTARHGGIRSSASGLSRRIGGRRFFPFVDGILGTQPPGEPLPSKGEPFERREPETMILSVAPSDGVYWMKP